jgi:hypothetical protein
LPRFTPVVARPEAFLDAKTDLMVAAEDVPGDGSLTYADAEKAVKEFRAGGFNDWRLPTVDELNALVDRERYNPAADPALNMKSDYYWTSSPVASDPGCAWFVDFYHGYVSIAGRNGKCRVRARARGQSVIGFWGSFQNEVIGHDSVLS